MSEILKKKFSARLRKILDERGWRPDDVARKSPRIKSAAVQTWMDGTRFPRPAGIVDLARALGMTAEDLLHDLSVPRRTMTEVEAIENAEAM